MEIVVSIVVAVAISSLTIVFQDLIKNFAAGLFIWREKRFVVDNIIGIHGLGDYQVVKLGWRSTLAVDTSTGVYTVLNNHDLVSHTVFNYSRSEWYYVRVRIPLDGNEDVEAVEELLLETAEDLDWIVFGVEVKVAVREIEDEYVVWHVSAPVQPTRHRRNWEEKLRRELLVALNEAGIEVGLPDRLRLKWEGRSLDSQGEHRRSEG